jgi:molybdopterin-guanine dinucleotide biosynthesis protein A
LSRNNSLIILAGGKGRRLGQEKAWVELKGQTLLERGISRLGSLVSQIIVVSAPGQKLPVSRTLGGLEVVEDIYPGKGPLVGIYSGLKACIGEGGFVTACDMPFVNPEFARYIINLSPGYDVVIPTYGELREPLHAYYSVECIDAIAKLIDKGNYKVRNLLEQMRVRYIEKGEIDRFDPEHISFFNINTYEDLEKAGTMASSTSENQLITQMEIA